LIFDVQAPREELASRFLQKKPQEARRYAFDFLSVYLPGFAFGSILKG
jgi:hypothetical protein